ncbi:glycosyltransferase family 2 protein [Pantoea sp. B65]|uniref:glycosyltransferase family 2 protein n=1 Tax=Pantoea sp. B65 TaxID=2813359 RepID=UPI0039B51B81
MSTPFFSVVVPAYNASESIEKTLLSVKNQTFTDYEVVIVDDASADFAALQAKVASFQQQGMAITLISFPENRNGAAARNEGIRKAVGRYIAFLDADDEWEIQKLQVHYDAILTQGDENIIFYSRLALIIDGVRRVPDTPARGIKKSESAARYIFGFEGVIQTSTIVLKRVDAEKIMFNENYRRHQDYDFCIRADVKGFRFVMIPETLSRYYVSRVVNPGKKKESRTYSTYWINDMSQYLTAKERACFNAFIMPYKYLDDGKKLGALKVSLTNIFKTDLEVIFFNISKKINKAIKAIAR